MKPGMLLRRNFILLLIFFGFFGYLISIAYADGLASETLPPVVVGGKSITLTIGSTPASTTDPSAGTEIGITLNENNNPVNSVTFAIESMRGDRVLFSHTFKSDNGALLLLISPQKTGDVTIEENYGGVPALFGGNNGNAVIHGPIFDSGGLYKFKIDILTMESYENKLSEPIRYNAAISIPEITKHQIHDNDYGDQTVEVVAYYDQINNFNYNSGTKFINFTMPFDWSSKNIDQVSVVHQEIRIPRTFGDFLVTSYEAYVNNIAIPDENITIDDYSSDNRTIHVILYQKELQDIVKQQNPKQVMEFALHPSDKAKFPITAFTRNAQFKVNLSWDPPKIIAGSTTKFYFKVLDPYLINKTVSSVNYDFSVIQNQQVIFKKSGFATDAQTSDNEIDVPIPVDSVGPIVMAFENLSGNSFAGVEFTSTVTKPPINPAFPVKLPSSLTLGESKMPGKYVVDLTWFPSNIVVDQQTEFVFTIKDKETGLPVPNSMYDFVILQKGTEVYRKQGTALAGGDYIDYNFPKGQAGPTTVRIENINNSGEVSEVSFVITPEFPLGLFSVIIIGFLSMIIFTRKTIPF